MRKTPKAKRTVGTTLPHSDFGAPDCCGCLNGIVRGDHAEIVCNECAAVVRTVPAENLEKTLNEMTLTLHIAAARCPHCKSVHLAPGLTNLSAFVCPYCGENMEVEKPIENGARIRASHRVTNETTTRNGKLDGNLQRFCGGSRADVIHLRGSESRLRSRSKYMETKNESSAYEGSSTARSFTLHDDATLCDHRWRAALAYLSLDESLLDIPAEFSRRLSPVRNPRHRDRNENCVNGRSRISQRID